MRRIKRPRLSKSQYKFFASTIKTISEGIILGSSAAFFLPETLQIKEAISVYRYMILLIIALTFLAFGAILERKGDA